MRPNETFPRPRNYALYNCLQIDSENCEICKIDEPRFEKGLINGAVNKLKRTASTRAKSHSSDDLKYDGWEDLAPKFATDDYPNAYGKYRKWNIS